MENMATFVKGYSGSNPFKDHQARTFGNDRLIKEFQPTSVFWSLFNDQHEILVGRRGSGKTILLKMMRHSLLKKVDDDRAKKIISDKKYFSIFSSTGLEFLGSFVYQDVLIGDKILFFQFAFNCQLALSLLHEINSYIKENRDLISRGIKSKKIAKTINSIWFPNSKEIKIDQIEDLILKIATIYENAEIEKGLKDIPTVFKKNICRPIQAVSPFIYQYIGFEKEPTWIVCIDEAEFIPEDLQRCINNLIRSDSRGIVIKMATMPYRHLTKETLVDGIFAESNGNDFNYRKLDLKAESIDFLNITDNLCKTRLKFSQIPELEKVNSLEDFIGKIGDDDFINYYQEELNKNRKEKKYLSHEEIVKKLITELSTDRQETIKIKEKSKDYDNFRKEIFDKFAPIFFTREMYRISKKGNTTPGWYCGTKMIRKISEGNPRQFIQIMNVLFEKAKETKLTPTSQHKEIYAFTDQNCEATSALPIHGPRLHEILKNISLELKSKTHDSNMIAVGNTFQFRKGTIEKNPVLVKYIELGVGHLKINVDEQSYINGITENTYFSLSNCFSAYYWIPMRKGDYPKMSIPFSQLKFNSMVEK